MGSHSGERPGRDSDSGPPSHAGLVHPCSAQFCPPDECKEGPGAGLCVQSGPLWSKWPRPQGGQGCAPVRSWGGHRQLFETASDASVTSLLFPRIEKKGISSPCIWPQVDISQSFRDPRAVQGGVGCGVRGSVCVHVCEDSPAVVTTLSQSSVVVCPWTEHWRGRCDAQLAAELLGAPPGPVSAPAGGLEVAVRSRSPHGAGAS